MAQAAVFLCAGIPRNRPRFGGATGPLAWLGWALIAYAAVAYPLLGLGLGHSLAEIPMFGVTPRPVTIFTFGLLLVGGVSVVLIVYRDRTRQGPGTVVHA